ncbi:hypothetical protein KXV52_001140, partial [Aspergillus fumigatus]
MSFGGFGGFGQNTQQSSGFGAGSGFGSTTSGGGLCWCLLTSTRDGLSQPLDLATTPRTTRDEGRRSFGSTSSPFGGGNTSGGGLFGNTSSSFGSGG